MLFGLLIILILIFLLLNILIKSFSKNIFITLLCTLVIFEFIFKPKICINSTLNGANLFFLRVFPSLFPFLVISNIMLAYDGIPIYSKILGSTLCKITKLPKECAFPLIVSMLCGYPLGAKYACDLLANKEIDYRTCERLINIASNAGPLFVIGAVGTSMLGSPSYGYMLMISNYLSCIAMGILLPVKYKITTKSESRQKHSITSSNFGIVLRDSIENSIRTSLSIFGFVVLFSVLIAIIKSNIIFDTALTNISASGSLSKDFIEGIFLGMIEMTNGCNIISLSSLSMLNKLLIVSFMLGFSGISIILQVYSFTSEYKLPLKTYINRKLLQGLICSIITFILYNAYCSKAAVATFSNKGFIDSYALVSISLIIFISPIILYRLKKLFYIS